MNQQDIFEIRVLDEKTGKQIDKVYLTKAQMEERGMPPNSVLYAVPIEGKNGKTSTIYLQKVCRRDDGRIK